MSIEKTVNKKLRAWLLSFDQYEVAYTVFNESKGRFVLSYDNLAGESKDVTLCALRDSTFNTLDEAMYLINKEFKRDAEDRAKDLNYCISDTKKDIEIIREYKDLVDRNNNA